jgi:hypothetical protein
MYLETRIKKLSVANKKKILKGLPMKICSGDGDCILLTKTQHKQFVSKGSMEISCSLTHCKKLHNFYNKDLVGGGGIFSKERIAPEPEPEPISELEKKQDDYEEIDSHTKLKKVRKKKSMNSVRMGKLMRKSLEAESDYRVEKIMIEANEDLIYAKKRADYDKYIMRRREIFLSKKKK